MHDVEAMWRQIKLQLNIIEITFTVSLHEVAKAVKSLAKPHVSAGHILNTSLYVTSNLFTLSVG